MLVRPSIFDSFKKYIVNKLVEIEQQYNIKILLAVESGSRAWGFPSLDSDYDVRFIYANYQDYYLTITQNRDFIESPICEDDFLKGEFDLNGWDVRKAIQLALKSNPVLMEWINSPIVYISNTDRLAVLSDFIKEAADLRTYCHHYQKSAIKAWDQILTNADQVRTKLYCYALRTALALEWVRIRKEIPPMDLPSLLKGIAMDSKLSKEIINLVVHKAKVREGDLIFRNPILDAYIESILEKQIPFSKKITCHDRNIFEEANEVFRRIIKP